MRKHLGIATVALFLLVWLPSSAQVDTTAVIAGWNLKGFTAIPDDRIERFERLHGISSKGKYLGWHHGNVFRP